MIIPSEMVLSFQGLDRFLPSAHTHLETVAAALYRRGFAESCVGVSVPLILDAVIILPFSVSHGFRVTCGTHRKKIEARIIWASLYHAVQRLHGREEKLMSRIFFLLTIF